MPLGLSLLLNSFGLLLLLFNKRSGFLFAFLGVSVLYASSITAVANPLITSLESRYPAQAIGKLPAVDTIVVLGGGLGPPIKPRLETEINSSSDRLYYAAKLYIAGKGNRILLSGGNVFSQPNLKSSAEYAAQILIGWGVPEEAIIQEGISRNTYENTLETKRLLNDSSTVLLVTSAFHMWRSVSLFTSQGIDVIPAPTDFKATIRKEPGFLSWLPRYGALNKSTIAFKEYLGYWVYRLKGWID